MREEEERELCPVLEDFMNNADFINGCIDNTRVGGKSNNYRVKLFRVGGWAIGHSSNKWKEKGIMLDLPHLRYHRYELEEYIKDGNGDEDSFLFELYCDMEKDLKNLLRLKFNRKAKGAL